MFGESPPFVCLGSSDNSSNLSLSWAGMSNVFEYLEALRRFHLVNCFLKSFPTHRTAMQRCNHSTTNTLGATASAASLGRGQMPGPLDSPKMRHSDPKALSAPSQKLNTKQAAFEKDNDKRVWNVPPHLLWLRPSNSVYHLPPPYRHAPSQLRLD